MSPFTDNNIAKLATITVTYNPEIELLKRQLESLPADCTKIIVDNASRPAFQKRLQQELQSFTNLHLILQSNNLGLGAAINCGAKAATSLPAGISYVLLLDQDSEPLADSVAVLLNSYERLKEQDPTVGCVGPSLIDPVTQLSHGFHQMTRLRWTRYYPASDSETPIPCANLNGSGTLMSLELFQHLGGLDEALFIDHVDTEWSFRVIAQGYSLWGVPHAAFKHSMGENSARIWLFGWRIWPVRTPLRHYFLFRNAALLFKRNYIPSVWKMWAIAKLILTAAIMSLTGPQRAEQLRQMGKGLLQGLRQHAD